MRSHLISLSLAFIVLLAPTCAQSPDANDMISFPAVGELSVVFPQNETYAVESPFPIIFGFHNAPAILSFDHFLDWSVNCTNATLFGLGSVENDIPLTSSSEDYFYLNSSTTLAYANADLLGSSPEFEFWGNADHDECLLEWTFRYIVTCEPLPDGGKRILTGYFTERRGTVAFSIRPGGTPPKDAMAAYEGCAQAGTAVGIASNISGCPQIADDDSPRPKPCELNVEAAASSLAEAAVAPTTSLTEISVSTTTTTKTTTESDPDSAGGATGGAAGGNDDEDAAPKLSIESGVLTLVILIVGGGMVPLLFF